MMSKFLLSTALVVAGATAGMAQGFSGASLGIEYTTYPDVDDLGGLNYFGSAEFDITPQIAAAVDITFYDFEVGSADISNFTAHGIYNLNAQTSLGVFVGQDRTDDTTLDNYGVEVAYDFGIGNVQGYLGIGDDSEDDINYVGVSAEYDFGSGFSFIGAYDAASIDDSSVSTLAIGGAYTLAAGPKFSASYGTLNLKDDAGFGDDTNFLEVAASISFGPNQGTTFGRRGFFEVLGFDNSDL